MIFSPSIFDVKGLSYRVNGQDILKNLSFIIKQGEYCAVIGPNGGGKTTLIRLLLGLEKPTSGEIRLFGVELKKFKLWHKIGYVPQRVAQIDRNFPANVYEVVQMGLTATRRDSTGKEEDIIESSMSKMDVLHLKNKLIGELSGGQRQRVMIARALASSPEVLILDEPNTGVDMKSQHRFYELLRELNINEGMTILFITHDIGVIADDIGRLFTVNQSLLTCNNPKEAISCDAMSKLYGIEAHAIYNHHHHH
jgi:zinc transport system ATP-binding protein